MTRARAWVSGAALAAMVQGGVARAADAERAAASETDRAQADGLFQDGVRAVHEGDLGRAKRLFAASYDLLPRGSTLGNLGHVEVDLGRLVDGLHHLKQALTMLEVGDAKRAAIQATFDAAYAKTGHLAIRTKPGAALTIDEAPVPGAAPFTEPIDVMPGRRMLEARLDGQKARQEVEAPAGSIVEVQLTVPVPPEPPQPPPAPPAPPTSSEPIGMPEPPPPAVANPSWWTAPRILGVGLGVGAAAGLGLGMVFHVAAVNDASDVGDMRSHFTPGACEPSASSAACSELRSKVDSVQENNTAATVSWALAGAAAAGAIVAFAFGIHGPEHASTGALVRPIVGPGVMGVEGHF